MPPDALTVERIDDAAALAALTPEWQSLWAAIPDATPFQSPDWLLPWWRHVGEGALLSFAFRHAGALVGFVPLYIYKDAAGARLLFPLGIATTDYLDAIVAPAWRAAVMTETFGQLADCRDRWDVAEWPQLRPDATLLLGVAPAGWQDTREAAEPCPVLPLPRDGADLATTVPAETLASHGRRIGRAARKHRLDWESARTHDAAALLEAHLALHAARWTKRGEAGVLAAQAVQAAHRESLPGMLRAGTLLLHALRLDDRIVATLHGFADPPGRAERRVYFYLGGFDPAFERLSPGMLVVGHGIAEALRDGAVAVDFLRGREAHKYAWGAHDTATWCRRLRRPA